MEMVLNNGFCEMTESEALNYDGGIGVLAAAGIITAACGAIAASYEAGKYVGKATKNIVNWIF